MNTSHHRIPYLLMAALLASAAFGASAQTPATASSATGSPPAAEQRLHGSHDGESMAGMQQRRAKHFVDLKGKLKLVGTQEAAWSAYTAASQPLGPPAQRHDWKAARAELDKLTTPQRLDRMQAHQADHAAMFAKRAEATRTFYAALTPEQQKTFDVESLRHRPHDAHRERGPQGPAGLAGQRPPPAPKN